MYSIEKCTSIVVLAFELQIIQMSPYLALHRPYMVGTSNKSTPEMAIEMMVTIWQFSFLQQHTCTITNYFSDSILHQFMMVTLW